MHTRPPRLGRYVLGAIAACFVVNLLIRSVLRIGGPLATLLAATLVAFGLAWVFRWRSGRRPYPLERRTLVALYALGLGLLYAGLLALMHAGPSRPAAVRRPLPRLPAAGLDRPEARPIAAA